MRLFPLIGDINETGSIEYCPQQGTRPFVLLLTVSGTDTLRDPRKGREVLRGQQAGGVASALHHQAAVLLRLCNDGDWIDIERVRSWVSGLGVSRRHEGKKKT